MRKKKRDVLAEFAEAFFRPSPFYRFLTRGHGKCRVPGCKRYSGKRPLCRRHQGSPKFQKLAQR